MIILIIALVVLVLSILAIVLCNKFIAGFNTENMEDGGWLLIPLVVGTMAALISGMTVTTGFYKSLGEQAGLEVEYRSNLPMKVNLINDLNNLSVVNPDQGGVGKGVITLDNMKQSSNVSEAIKDLQLSISIYNKEVQAIRMRQKHPFIAIPIIKTEYVYRLVTLHIIKDNKLELVDTP